ncbi:DUF1428 domain-containing protein [Marinobacter fonticola]|uniref:DUF1428 domain-containing protein n=1 Tax=Marinobacter fonticola TaxID=2603215 RepID=UPI0011E73AC2|nr:DUF1428 domain-containing protein [Marinobacter fonticola]
MSYVDGFVVAVAAENKEDYIRVAKEAAGIFKDHGALQVVECWEDDVPEGKVTSFPMAVQRKDGEKVVFSWILWPDRAARDEGMKKSMEDSRMNMDMSQMPFDGQRMIFGGFEKMLDL